MILRLSAVFAWAFVAALCVLAFRGALAAALFAVAACAALAHALDFLRHLAATDDPSPPESPT